MIHLRRLSLHTVTTSALWLLWILTLIAAIAGPTVATLLGTPDPSQTMTRSFDPPSTLHPLGTDRLGRDLLARMLSGNIGLVIPPAIAAVIATAIGLLLALVASISPLLRAIIRFFGDIVLVIPAMIILLAVITAAEGSFLAVATATVALSVPLSTRYFIAAARPIFAADYVIRARATGSTWPQIIGQHILPALRRPIIADIGIRFVTVVFLTATAAFLAGTSGAQENSWAAMVSSGLNGVDLNPWAVIAPVVAIIALTACPALLLEQHTGGRR
ncbi:ABC transporter permease [Corynebacterium diphtheriae]|uniref:ABC transporter permease n=1 Tax=Corynebacterium diphtheriae TaxID=1717 RepID=UPI000245AE91|nr:ABC transporter permease subunit [Corynebacterium diphtheriae]AEX47315.1 ABC-type peptide/nickel transporter permease protein [Corynebacterium diphtheriae INCA 402]AEX79773.1 ABC-type peptide/nickel transporter permease protein [Corynebacterium diphtheriae HC03]KJJ59942.1 ABC transporter permease [Corynebacterium diphtheriae]CAB0778786.1 ABC transporter permease [Corynebacterium diphtheriae]CAB0919368.1 ABC transporter permease [Corynebacterium diphtheriae]